MAAEVVWLPAAVEDLQRLREFIRTHNPDAAARAAKRIIEATTVLVNNPEAGRPLEDCPPFRELILPFGDGNYVMRYRNDGARVVIVRIRHSKQAIF